jgi:hypothetical protein
VRKRLLTLTIADLPSRRYQTRAVGHCPVFGIGAKHENGK